MSIEIRQLNSVSVDGLKQAILDGVELRHATFIWGSYGLGKTEIVESTLRSAGYEPITWFRGTQASPDMVAGFPFVHDGQLKRAEPELFAAVRRVVEAGGRPAVFLDELNLSSPMMLAALLQFLLERRLGQHAFPEDMPIIAAGNLETDGSLVAPMPKPAANRLAHVFYEGPTIDEWVAWAANSGIHPVVVGFLKDTPGRLKDYAMAKESDRVPTPRTWKFVSDALHLLDRRDADDVERMAVISRYVGDAAATDMERHLQYGRMLVPLHDIIRDPDNARLPDDTNSGAMFMQQMQLLSAADESNVGAIVKYVARWPKDRIGQFANMVITLATPERRSLFIKEGRIFSVIDDSAFDEAYDLSNVLRGYSV